jgi:hypothetical protein
MNLTAEQIQDNWNELMSYIEDYISSPRKEQLIDFYNKFQERIILMPAAHKKEYHNAFPGGYVEHVNRVIKCSLKQSELCPIVFWHRLSMCPLFPETLHMSSQMFGERVQLSLS